ncbi:hypothetical protein [Stakelama flava]|uniref:hypothetical protein n=1 Tax=Stakelama flava TaxID=2860338 RepID=UPI001C5B7FEE
MAPAWSQPARKRLIFSDGMDVDTIERVYRHFHGRLRMGFRGNLTSDFRNCDPGGSKALVQISLVTKATSATASRQ